MGGAGILLGIPLALFVLAGLGCSQKLEPYDPLLRYELRGDPIVVGIPPATPTKDDLPKHGKVNEFLLDLPKLGGKILDPKSLSDVQQAALRELLDDRFGAPATPRNPTVEPELGLDAETLSKGSSSYRVRCTQCHGISGDARGPTGPWIYPYPRDFRSGQFKRSTSAVANGKPRLDDLVHNMRAWVPGTSMPMFDLLSPEDLHALAAYVVHLSIRGEVELRLIRDLLSDDGDANADLVKAFETNYARVISEWKMAQSAAHSPIPVAESLDEATIRRGHVLFTSAGCISCHANFGNSESYRFDIWGFPNVVTNLRQPERRWGKETCELASTVRRGIPPANMPAAVLSDADLTDLVSFLRALPYPAQLPGDVRNAVEAAR
ncbi:MAG: Cytochrome c [Frankiales bacterium]|nr:Cytochrome c [Frankiales bacterium]